MAPNAFPAEHWRRLRTTNPIKSSFATIRLRTKLTKGGHELVTELLDGAVFKDGERVTDEDNNTNSIDEKVAV
jgi:hypothetical protein